MKNMGQSAPAPTLEVGGAALFKRLLPRVAQREMVVDVRQVVEAAPLIRPVTRWGKPMKVRMTAAGTYGWISDRRGYRYAARHPEGMAWPPIPASVLAVWHAVSGCQRAPECCLVNYYGEGTGMGLHQDRDETDFDAPVVSISLGDSARFRIGGTERGGPTQSVMLESGDVLVMGGPARLAFHGIDRVVHGSSDLLPKGGRINLTLRVVT